MEMVNVISLCVALFAATCPSDAMSEGIDVQQSTNNMIYEFEQKTSRSMVYGRSLDLDIAIEEETVEEIVEEIEEEIIEIDYTHKDYRQTYYSVEEGEVALGAGFTKNSPEIEVIDNVMHFDDEEFGLLPIYAININEVMASGLNHRGTPNLYGSVIEVNHEGEEPYLAIILDACGACSRADKIDLWVYSNNAVHDKMDVEFRYIRGSWDYSLETPISGF